MENNEVVKNAIKQCVDKKIFDNIKIKDYLDELRVEGNIITEEREVKIIEGIKKQRQQLQNNNIKNNNIKKEEKKEGINKEEVINKKFNINSMINEFNNLPSTIKNTEIDLFNISKDVEELKKKKQTFRDVEFFNVSVEKEGSELKFKDERLRNIEALKRVNMNDDYLVNDMELSKKIHELKIKKIDLNYYNNMKDKIMSILNYYGKKDNNNNNNNK